MNDTYSKHVVAWISRGWTEDSVVEDDVGCLDWMEKVRIYQKVRIKNLTEKHNHRIDNRLSMETPVHHLCEALTQQREQEQIYLK